jgi:hypothetical protein
LNQVQVLVYSPPGAVADFCRTVGVGHIDLKAMNAGETIEPVLGCPYVAIVCFGLVAQGSYIGVSVLGDICVSMTTYQFGTTRQQRKRECSL